MVLDTIMKHKQELKGVTMLEQAGHLFLAAPHRTPGVNDCGCGFSFMFNTVHSLGLTGSTHGHPLPPPPRGACGGAAAAAAAQEEDG